MSQVREYFAHLADEGLLEFEDLVGCDDAEIEQVRVAQHVRRMPEEYREYLALAGKRQGGLLRGSDWTFRDALVLAEDAREVLAENNLPADFIEGALIFFMHGGYVFFYFPADTLESNDPPVWMYEEDAPEPPHEIFPSFTAWLRSTEPSLRKMRELDASLNWTRVSKEPRRGSW